MSVVSSPCNFCSFDVPVSSDRCPHCARPSLFPNVTLAGARAQTDALDARFSVVSGLVGQISLVLQRFLEEVNYKSEAVIARPAAEVFRLATSDRELYANFYGLIDAGTRLPNGGHWDSVRETVDSKFFPYFKEHIRFGALTLNGKGLANYGDCFILLRDDMVGHRSTVFEENTINFCEKKNIALLDGIPIGHTATWLRRGQLAATKLWSKLHGEMIPLDFQRVLMSPATTSADDDFIEVHIYGSISIRSVSSVSIDRNKSSVKIRALREKLTKQRIQVNEH